MKFMTKSNRGAMTEYTQTNINLTIQDHEKLVAMMDADGYVTKSPFVRWLIRQEFDRRNPEGSTIQDRDIQLAAKSQ